MTLRELQRDFFVHLTGGPSLDCADPRGMRVYMNNYRGQLVAALRDIFEKTALWLGDDAFDGHAHDYIDTHVPSSWTLDAYGVDFPDHLGRALPDLPEAAELAWLDAALRRAFSSPDVPPLTLDELIASDWSAVEFVFVPSLMFRHLHTDAVAIWGRLSAGETLPVAAAPTRGPVAVRVWRQGLTPRFASVSPEEGHCLDLALAGGSFGEICSLLAQVADPDPDAVARKAGLLLREWVGDGLVSALREARVR